MSLRTCLTPLALVLAATGCSLPHTTNGGLRPAAPPAPAPSSVAPPTGLAAIQACDLLTVQELGSLGVPAQGRPETVVGLRRCDWGDHEGGIAIGIDEQGGIDNLNLADASSVTDVMIGRHRAKRAVEGSGPGYCDVHFAVGDTASVTVQALYLNDTPRACAAADRAAAFVEPKLP
ncbi:MAG TPA: DUF3558 family protein [Pseudonocardiaceae bacterium]|nr:DUF3558 family protein [Pseudonocardiaceae bacterium]